MKKIKILSVLVILFVFLFPNIVVIAQEKNISQVENLNEEDIRKIKESIKNIPQEITSLPDKPPTTEEIDKFLEEKKNNPEEKIRYESKLNKDGLKNATLGSCFDVYKFGNINLSIQLDKSQYEPSGFIKFNGKIENKNNYPLPDIKIRAKIVKIETEGNRRIVKTVDEIVLKDNINLASNGSQAIEGIYDIPIKAAKGDYEILLTVIQNNRISISGLTFTDDVYSFNPSFKIGGNNQEEISIKQSDIKINDETYNNLSFNPRYKEIKPITIKVPVQNNSEQDKEIEIEYEIYSWSDDLGKPKTKLVQQQIVSKKSTTIASYTIKDIKEAVYYIKVKIKDTKTKENIMWPNIANIRFSNETIDQPRIAATLLNTNPYSPEQELKLLTCIHNTNSSEVDTILENTIKDDKGKVIASSEYRGKLTGEVDGIYTSMPKNKRYNKLLVNSTIKDKDGNILNTVELNYDCKDLDPSKCIENKNNIWLVIFSIISGSFIVLLAVLIYRKKINKIKV